MGFRQNVTIALYKFYSLNWIVIPIWHNYQRTGEITNKVLGRDWIDLEIKENIIIPLGYGKFVRSDKIIALEPIEEDRGPGRRTRVYVEQIDIPLIASRTETAVLANIVETPKEVMEATAALELLHDIYDDIHQIGPMLRKSIRKEAQLDLDKTQRRIEEILKHEVEF